MSDSITVVVVVDRQQSSFLRCRVELYGRRIMRRRYKGRLHSRCKFLSGMPSALLTSQQFFVLSRTQRAWSKPPETLLQRRVSTDWIESCTTVCCRPVVVRVVSGGAVACMIRTRTVRSLRYKIIAVVNSADFEHELPTNIATQNSTRTSLRRSRLR